MSGPGGVGFFGKLPGMGDFVQRRLPPAFVAAWDDDFEAGVNAARAALGADWRAAWQAAPVWRFVLAPGVCGTSAWVGVTGPSVDRVGRGFPMVLASAVADADALTRIARDAGGWFDLLENACREANGADALTVDQFDAWVAALPDPLAWMDAAAAPARVDWSLTGSSCMAWHSTGTDRALAAWAAACVDAGDGCLWWTRGGCHLPPQARLTRGLPRAETYVAFVANSLAAARVEPGLAPLPAVEDGVGTLADLVPVAGRATDANDNDDTVPMACLRAAVPPAVTESTVTSPVEPSPVSTIGVVCRHAGGATLVAADNGAPDPRRSAAAQVNAQLVDTRWDEDIEALRARLLALHLGLRARSEDLIDPVPEDGAVIVAAVEGDRATLLRIGAATAWHWRCGQLRPVFAEAPPPDQADTVRPDDLLGPAPRGPQAACGLGAPGAVRCDATTCMVMPDDRLLLLATDTLTKLPAEALATALAGTASASACGRIAAAAGLGMERARWPLAVIEVGT